MKRDLWRAVLRRHDRASLGAEDNFRPAHAPRYDVIRAHLDRREPEFLRRRHVDLLVGIDGLGAERRHRAVAEIKDTHELCEVDMLLRETAAKDVVLLGPPTADGAGVHVIRARHERIEVGELRALQEGRPIVGEIVTLTPREANPRVCDVTESYSPSAAQPAQLGHKGPANVATDAYREGWDEIFGPKPRTPHGAN